MEETNGAGAGGAAENKDVIYLMGGLALMVLGAGLVMANPSVRRTVSSTLSGVLPDLRGKFLPDLTALGPDIDRYMKLRAM